MPHEVGRQRCCGRLLDSEQGRVLRPVLESQAGPTDRHVIAQSAPYEEQRMIATGIRMTADQLLCLPDQGKRYELVRGELHEMAPAGGEHGYVALEAAFRLRAFLAEHPEIGGRLFAAETGFRLSRDPDTVRAPDVAFVAADRLAQARVPGYPELAPDLVVEVVSPSDTAGAIQAKIDEWLQAGVRLAWVLYPATRSAMAFHQDGTTQLLHADDSLDGEPVLPGFSCRLGELF